MSKLVGKSESLVWNFHNGSYAKRSTNVFVSHVINMQKQCAELSKIEIYNICC